MRRNDGVPRIRVLEPLLVDPLPLVELLLEERVDQELLVGEAPVDGADADARVMSDVVQRDAEPALGEQLPRRLEDALPVPLGVPAKSCFSTHSPSLAPNGFLLSIWITPIHLWYCAFETDTHPPLRSWNLKTTTRKNLHDTTAWTRHEKLLLLVLGG